MQNKFNSRSCIQQGLAGLSMLFLSLSYAVEVPIYDFPLHLYSQNVEDYFPPNDLNYTSSLVKSDYQQSQLNNFLNHYYSTNTTSLSPWGQQMVTSVLPIVKKIEYQLLEDFDNQNKNEAQKHYGENFKLHDQVWLNKIKRNMNLDSINLSNFTENNRAIAVTNTFARALPEAAPDFFHFSLPGQGFPFDNLQESAIWVGTPLYVLNTSKDKAWSLVLTPDAYFAWVKTTAIAYASPGFITQWQKAANQGLMAVTHTEVSVFNAHGQFQFSAYIGSVFPKVKNKTALLIPSKDSRGHAVTRIGFINKNKIALMPLQASRENFIKIIKQLQNRPYGWGGIFFYNDCSQELKSLFTPFGIWLPRNSAQQGMLSPSFDLTAKNQEERLHVLKIKAHPLMTLIYVGKHVMLYLGHVGSTPITYQNVWGFSPAARDKRYVVGQSTILPLLNYYPEIPDIRPQVDNPVFKLIYLDMLGTNNPSPQAFINHFMATPGS